MPYMMLKLATKCAPRSDCLENAYRAGFRHVELWLDQGVLTDLSTTLQQVNDYPNGYALHFPNQLNLASETLTHAISLYRQVGSRCLIIHQPMFDKYREPLLR